MHIYIHIPFCKNICTYCDFPKVFYENNWADQYLTALSEEIKKEYNNEEVTTIYIGGGTPSSLSESQLKKLFEITSTFKQKKEIEFTFECNPLDITKEKLKLLKSSGVDRISIGVQSFNDRNLKFLGRKHSKKEAIKNIKLVKKYIKNINIDLMYAIPGQSLEDLDEDMKTIIKLDPTHISAYSLIIEENTKLYINKTKNINEEKDYKMYKLINDKLKESGYEHYEISNYSKTGYKSKHNLGYWDYEDYYGFGLGAHSLLKEKRYENTKSFNKYIDGNFRLKKTALKKEEREEEFIMLGLRKIDGINKKEFKERFKKDIETNYNTTGLKPSGDLLRVPEDKLYVMNEILINIIKE